MQKSNDSSRTNISLWIDLWPHWWLLLGTCRMASKGTWFWALRALVDRVHLSYNCSTMEGCPVSC